MEKKQMSSIFLVIFLLPHAEITESKPSSHKHFVLIHGSCLGAWSWYKLVTLLKSSGYRVTALDLAASGIDPIQVSDIPSVSDYFKPLKNFMTSLPRHERVVLVGHSFGGFAISQAMENFPEKISVAVFVTAMMPGPSLNISTLFQESFKRNDSVLDSRYTYDNGPNNPPTTFIFGPQYLIEKVYQHSTTESFKRNDFVLDSRYTYDNGPNNPPTTFIFGPRYLTEKVYQHSPTEDVDLANMLLRPLRLYSEENMSNEIKLSNEKYGSVRRVFILSEKDELVKTDLQRWMIMKNRPDQVEEIKGSDHMVMISKPLELFVLLQSIGRNYS